MGTRAVQQLEPDLYVSRGNSKIVIVEELDVAIVLGI